MPLAAAAQETPMQRVTVFPQPAASHFVRTASGPVLSVTYVVQIGQVDREAGSGCAH
jgi:hypothetical protein